MSNVSPAEKSVMRLQNELAPGEGTQLINREMNREEKIVQPTECERYCIFGLFLCGRLCRQMRGLWNCFWYRLGMEGLNRRGLGQSYK